MNIECDFRCPFFRKDNGPACSKYAYDTKSYEFRHTCDIGGNAMGIMCNIEEKRTLEMKKILEIE
jgi:hypothetical protein